MSDPLKPILDQIAKLWGKVDLIPVIRWGSVTQTTPLRVRLDGDADPLPFTPSSLISGLTVGARVVCVEQHRRVIVVTAPPVAATTSRAGVAELATQAEVDAGTDASRMITPATLRARSYAPFAVAAGSVTVEHPAATVNVTGVTITLPTGRFTQAPLPTVNLQNAQNGSAKCNPRIYAASSTSLTAGVWSGDQTAAGVTHSDVITWHAVQMTAGSSTG